MVALNKWAPKATKLGHRYTVQYTSIYKVTTAFSNKFAIFSLSNIICMFSKQDVLNCFVLFVCVCFCCFYLVCEQVFLNDQLDGG